MVELESNRNLFRGLIGGATLVLMATQAMATEGYFQLGFGPRQNAVGGAGVADSRDAMAAALNPAGIVGLPEQFQIGAALFMPYRGYTATGPGFVAPGMTSGDVDSTANEFVVPNISYVRPIDKESALAFTIYGNGGMNTTYKGIQNSSCASPPFPSSNGVFCGGNAGVDLIQAFMSATYARQIGGLKIGIAPTLVMQRFKADGLGAFGGLTVDPTALTNNGYDYSYGGGLRAGLEYELTKAVRIGLSGQTKMYMSKFEKYAGLFADGGDFDIPASMTAGISVDATPDFTVMFDYQHIFYSGVAAVSDSSSVPLPFGSNGGPGFGWNDVDVLKIGAEWRFDRSWSLRAGYAHSTNPIGSSDVTLNILAPGVVENHITGGVAYKLNDRSTVEFSGMYVPESSVAGVEVTPMGPNPSRNIELHMHQYQFLVGWTYKM